MRKALSKVKQWFLWLIDEDYGYNEVERRALNNIRGILRRQGFGRKYIRQHIVQVKLFVLLPREKRRALVSRAKNAVAQRLKS